MQLFWLDKDPETSATYYSDRHVNKIILEIAQCVSTALRKKGYDREFLYQKTHTSHPVVEWIEESSKNMKTAIRVTRELNKEYKYRDNNRENHKSWLVLDQIDVHRAAQVYKKHRGTIPPLAIRDDLKRDVEDISEVVQAYREYYLRDKLIWSDGKVATWTKRGRPEWMLEAMRDPFTKTQIDYSGLNI